MMVSILKCVIFNYCCIKIPPTFNRLANKYWCLWLPVGQKFRSGLTRWFWLRILWSCSQDVHQGCRCLKGWLQPEKLLPGWLMHLSISWGSQFFVDCRRPLFLSSRTSPWDCFRVLIKWHQLPFVTGSSLERGERRKRDREREWI